MTPGRMNPVMPPPQRGRRSVNANLNASVERGMARIHLGLSVGHIWNHAMLQKKCFTELDYWIRYITI